MIPSAHVYGHHPFQGGDSPWMHQQQPAHHQPGGHQGAVSVAQQHQQQHQQHQHFSRMSGNHSAAGTMAQDAGHENISEENRRTMAYIADLLNENTREAALLELSKKREQVPELALILWHSFGTLATPRRPTRLTRRLGVMTSLLQEIISVYTLLNPSQLTAAASNRVCNALALLQCVASHNDTRALFLNGTTAHS